MKKILILTLCLISCSNAFAYISGKSVTDEKPVYCPSEIKCTENGKLNSCKFDSDDKQFFGELSFQSIGEGKQISERYPFEYASAPFHSNSSRGICRYYISDSGYLILPIKPESNLEAYYQKRLASSWNFNGSGVSSCASTASSCPLKQRLGFVIHNANLINGVVASINDKEISKFITVLSSVGIIYDDALIGCSNEKECIIDLLDEKHVEYGSVKVDMDSMKILHVNSLDPTIEINKIGSFNSIEIKKKIPEEKAIYCPSQIKCSSGAIESCTFESTDASYFGSISGYVGTSAPKSFSFSSAYTQISSVTDSFCSYTNDNDGYVHLSIRPEANLQAYYLKSDSAWQDIGIATSQSHCSTSNVTLCPFKQEFGFLVHNVNISSGIYAAINGNILVHQGYPFHADSNSYQSIIYDDVLTECNGKKECTIDLFSEKNVKYGSVKFDMKNMKILETHSLYSGKIDINNKTIESLNTSIVEASYPRVQ